LEKQTFQYTGKILDIDRVKRTVRVVKPNVEVGDKYEGGFNQGDQ
jgi:hypothetical protein